MLDIISWLATGLSLLGQLLINKKKISAFPVWIISNLLWIVVNFLSVFNIANVAMYMIYCLMNIHGLYEWHKASKNALKSNIEA